VGALVFSRYSEAAGF